MLKSGLIWLTACVLVCGLAVGSVSNAHAEAGQGNVQVYSIKYYDGLGHLTGQWEGSYVDQQKVLQAERAKRPTTRPAGVPQDKLPTTGRGVPTQSMISPLINRVNGCTDPNDFWDVRNYPPLVCFASAGSVSTAIYYVYEVDSGNNTGHFSVYPGAFPQFLIYIDQKYSAAICNSCTWYDVSGVWIN